MPPTSRPHSSATRKRTQAAFDTDYDYLFNFIVVGDSFVGKSSLVKRFSEGRFSQTTIGMDFRIRSLITATGKKVKLQIWDTAGQEWFHTFTSSYYRRGNSIVLCYDTTDRVSFEHLRAWLREVRTYARPDCRVMIVGTKTDLANAIKTSAMRQKVTNDSIDCGAVDVDDIWWSEREDAQAFADELGVPLLRCSAKSGDGVEELFTQFAESLVKDRTKFEPRGASDCTYPVYKDTAAVKLGESKGIAGFLSRVCFG